MPEKIVQPNENVIEGQIKELVRGSVEESPQRKEPKHFADGLDTPVSYFVAVYSAHPNFLIILLKTSSLVPK